MMKLKMAEPHRVQRTKYTSHENSTSTCQRKENKPSVSSALIFWYKVAFRVQCKLYALCKDDPSLKIVIQLRHIVN